MDDTMEEQDRKDAIACFRLYDVDAYEDDGNVYVKIPIYGKLFPRETHVAVSKAEVMNRATLWREDREERIITFSLS